MSFQVAIIEPPEYANLSDLNENLFCEQFKKNNQVKLILYPVASIYQKLFEEINNNQDLLEEVNNKVITLFSKIASEFKIYISPGYIIQSNTGNGLYRIAVLFNPEGEIVLQQRQLFINEKTKKYSLLAGNKLNLAETELGCIGFLTGDDCFYPEIGRFLLLKGVDIILAINDYKKVNCWRQLAGVWSQVQQNQFFALEASIYGQSLIHGPCEITPYRTGIIAPVGKEEEAMTTNPADYFSALKQKEWQIDGYKCLIGSLQMAELKEIREEYPLRRHLNPRFYQKSGLEALLPSGKGGV